MPYCKNIYEKREHHDKVGCNFYKWKQLLVKEISSYKYKQFFKSLKTYPSLPLFPSPVLTVFLVILPTERKLKR